MVYKGSKSRLSKELVPIINYIIETSGFDKYIEPFVGGCNIIDKIKAKNKIGNDKNDWLMFMIDYFVKNPCDYKQFDPTNPDFWINKEDWYKCWHFYKNFTLEDVISMFGKFSALKIAVAGIIYGFSGKFFSSYGLENKTKHYRVECQYRNFERQLPLLKNVFFRADDYSDVIKEYSNSVYYLDPPYGGDTKYGKIKWDKQRWEELLNNLPNNNNIYLYSTVELLDPNKWDKIYMWPLKHQISGNFYKQVIENLYVYKNDAWEKIKMNVIKKLMVIKYGN